MAQISPNQQGAKDGTKAKFSVNNVVTDIVAVMGLLERYDADSHVSPRVDLLSRMQLAAICLVVGYARASSGMHERTHDKPNTRRPSVCYGIAFLECRKGYVHLNNAW